MDCDGGGGLHGNNGCEEEEEVLEVSHDSAPDLDEKGVIVLTREEEDGVNNGDDGVV